MANAPGYVWAQVVDAFGAGMYLLFGILQLDLWNRHRDRAGHLWLAGASFSALAVDVTGMGLRHVGFPAPSLLSGINTAGVALTTVCLFELALSFGASRPGAIARGGEAAFLALAFAGGSILPGLQPVALLASGAILFGSMVLAVRAAFGEFRELKTVALGFVFLMACLLADLLKELGLAEIPSGLPILGFTVLFLASARSLHDRFEREETASRTDPLTGLPNRRGFLEASDNALARSRRSKRPVSVALADLDHFKRINDTLGHAAGDDVLRAVASTLRSSLRAQDTVARWGGEEFILLLPDTGADGAARAAETARLKVAALSVGTKAGSVSVTLSLGVAEHRLDRTLEETIALADEALYRAKEAGRDRVAAH